MGFMESLYPPSLGCALELSYHSVVQRSRGMEIEHKMSRSTEGGRTRTRVVELVAFPLAALVYTHRVHHLVGH
jgi:hypothetical protein